MQIQHHLISQNQLLDLQLANAKEVYGEESIEYKKLIDAKRNQIKIILKQMLIQRSNEEIN